MVKVFWRHHFNIIADSKRHFQDKKLLIGIRVYLTLGFILIQFTGRLLLCMIMSKSRTIFNKIVNNEYDVLLLF